MNDCYKAFAQVSLIGTEKENVYNGVCSIHTMQDDRTASYCVYQSFFQVQVINNVPECLPSTVLYRTEVEECKVADLEQSFVNTIFEDFEVTESLCFGMDLDEDAYLDLIT